MVTHSKDGSRNLDGSVPYVYWNSDNRKVYVNWYDVRNANPRNGLRSEVSATQPRSFAGFCVCGAICLIHPFAILDVSIMRSAIRKYVFSSMILSSCSVRTRCLSTSSEPRTCSSIGSFSDLHANAAQMMFSIVSSAILSMCA